MIERGEGDGRWKGWGRWRYEGGEGEGIISDHLSASFFCIKIIDSTLTTERQLVVG